MLNQLLCHIKQQSNIFNLLKKKQILNKQQSVNTGAQMWPSAAKKTQDREPPQHKCDKHRTETCCKEQITMAVPVYRSLRRAWRAA